MKKIEMHSATITARPCAILVSDACLGYGSPQIPALARTIAQRFDARVIILEPDIPELPAKHASFPDLEVIRLYTDASLYKGGRAQYCKKAAEMLNNLKPSIVVIICTFCMPTLLHLNYRPSLTTFYSIESIIQYGYPDIHLSRELRRKVDFIIWPEENRAERDTARCWFEDIPSKLMLNSANSRLSVDAIVPAQERERRIIHQGTIGIKETFSNYFLDPQIYSLPIDIFGPLVDDESQALTAFRATSERPPGSNMIYHGRVNLEQLGWFRKRRAFLLTIWSPEQERGHFAPSNKFFEAIADGVPPITAPHPQHVRLIEKYDCGIILNDWSKVSLRQGLTNALTIFGTSRYLELVENCKKAVRQELNYETQVGAAVQQMKHLWLNAASNKLMI